MENNNKVSRYYGKLPPEMLSDLDALLVKMRRVNRKVVTKKTINRKDIVPLPDDEYVRLWGYLRHCCSMVTTWRTRKSATTA